MIKDLLPSDPVTVGPYRLLGRLGRGGMGQVYLGRSSGGRRVAVKVIRPELADDVEFRARFAREVAAARGVSGMFTALLIDADPAADQPWLATAYVPGPSLAEAVATGGPLPARTVLGLAAGLAEGLQAIHQAGVVHRDLKPSNVLLAADGPRVIDFGISRAREASMLTVSGVIVGTPGFLSPEQAKGRPVGPSSDIFSLGGVLTYAATGAGPFGSGTPDAMVYRVVEQEPELSEVPAELRPVVERCLAKDPDARPTAAELLAELDRLGADIGVDTPEWLPAAVADSLARYSPTDEVPAALSAAESASPVADASSDTVDLPPAEPKPTLPPPTSATASGTGLTGRRRRLLLAGVAAAVLLAGLGVGAGVAFSGSPDKVAGGPVPSVVASTGKASAAATRTAGPSRSPSATPKHSPSPKRTAASRPAHHAAKATHTAVTSAVTSPAAPTDAAGPTQAAPTTAAPTTAAPTTAAPATSAPARKPSPTPTPPATQSIGGYSGATYYPCSDEGSIDSVPGGGAVSFTFSNDSSADIEAYALTSAGGAGGGVTVGPHSSSTPGATADQAWLVENASGGCLGIVQLDGSGGVTVS